jgi:hypothetical protein
LIDVSFDFGGPDDEFESEYEGFDGLDMIGDSETDMEHGTFDDKDDEPNFEDFEAYGFGEEVDTEMLEPLQEQVNKTLDMFKRFKNY